MIVEIGNYEYSCKNLIPELLTAHPRNFRDILASLPPDSVFFTNNTDVMDRVSYDEIVVIEDDGSRKSLKDHFLYEKWKKEFSPGEFFRVVIIR